MERCFGALIPLRNFLELVDGKPDLYGPFWIPTTVVLTLFFSSTVAGFIAAHISSETFSYDFNTLTIAASLMYSYAFGIPVVLWLVLKWYKCEPSLLECLCLYGYSLTVWIFAALVSIAPMEVFHWSTLATFTRWISATIGFVVSSIFLIRNLYPVLSRADAKTSRLLVLAVLLCNAGLSLAFKFVFFA